jgi:predicted acylesterase/phospholipase RssA
LSCQYTEQIDILIDTLIGAGASFMFMTGTSEDDFKRFQNKLDGFEYEDLRDMEKYSSLNLIYYSGGYASFISKLPAPVS